jgi:hypothetical protein
MTSEEAKLVLRAYRSGDNSPLVQTALAQARWDDELGAWLAEQETFDQAMTQSLAETPVPPHLNAVILQHAARPRTRRSPLVTRVRWGLAASLLLAGIVLGLVYGRPSRSTEDFRVAMVEHLWVDLGEHVDFESSNLVEVRRWLGSNGAAADFSLPAAVTDMRIRGAQVVNWSGQKVASLCLLGDGKHLHMFVVPVAALANTPPEHLPDFEKCNGWRTVAWTYRSNTYLLSGMDTLSFIKKTRRARQWAFAG